VRLMGVVGAEHCEDSTDVVKAVKCCLGWLKFRRKLCSVWQINCVLSPHSASWQPMGTDGLLILC
jgi:hypothetical protein